MTLLRRPEDVLKTSVSAGTHFTQPVVLKVSIYAKLSIIISKTLDTSNLNRLLILEIRIIEPNPKTWILWAETAVHRTSKYMVYFHLFFLLYIQSF